MAEISKDVLEKILERGTVTAPPIDTPDGGKALIVPEGYRVTTLSPLEQTLPRIRQSATFYDLESFTAYVNLFKGEGSRIFALPGYLAPGREAFFKAVLDFHTKDKPAYGVHVVTYAPKYSEAWERWMAKANQPLLQADFGEFLEERKSDIRQPIAADLIDLVNKFKATKKVDYNMVTNTPSGDVQIGYTETTEVMGKDRNPITVPASLLLGIPVFFKDQAYEVVMLMRYKAGDGKVTFTIKPDGIEYIEQDAFDSLAAKIEQATGIKPFFGVLSR